MKAWLFAIAFFLTISHLTHAQNLPIQATVSVAAPYTNLFSDYLSGQKINITLVGKGNVRLTGYLKGSTGLSYTLPPNLSHYTTGVHAIVVNGVKKITTLDLQESFTSNNIVNASQGNAKDLLGNFKLPEGDYELCVKMYDVNSDTPLSDQVCAYFTVSNLEAPFLISPADKDAVTNASAIFQPMQFQWTFPSGANPARIVYDLQIAELRPGQNAFNVFESGPLFAEIAINNSSPVYLTKPIDPRFEVGKQYAWRVQVRGKDPNRDSFVFQNDGKSQVFSFTYGGDAAVGNGDLAVSCAYPKPGSAIPFRGIPLIVRFDPYKTNFKKFSSDLTVRSGDGSTVQAYSNTDDWTRFGSPREAQQFVITGDGSTRKLTDEDAQHIPVNRTSGAEAVDLARYEDHRQLNWSVAVSMVEGNANPVTRTANVGGSFTAGMGKPILTTPASEARFDKGDNTEFTFQTSQRPPDDELFPREIVQAKPGQPVGTYKLSVRERAVLEISSDSTFKTPAKLIKRESFGITLTPEAMPDPRQMADATYKTLKTTVTLTEGRYFWRVRWLTRPDGVEDGPAYAESDIRALCIGAKCGAKKDTILPPVPDPIAGACNCKFPALTDKKPKATKPVVGDAIYIGGTSGTGYQLSISTVASHDPATGKSTGTGTVALALDLKPMQRGSGLFVPVKVQFTDLQYNADKQMIGGKVFSRTGGQPTLIPSPDDKVDMPGLSDLKKVADNWDDISKNLTALEDKLVDAGNAQKYGAGLDTPIGVKNAGGLVTIAIDNFIFTAASAQFDALTVFEEKNVFGDKPLRIPLGAKGVCMPLMTNCSIYTLYLVDDMPLGNTGLTLKGGSDLANATYLLFKTSDKDAGVKELNIVATYDMPSTMKTVADNGKVVATLRAKSTKGFSNWRAQLQLNAPFKIDGLDDFSFALTDPATYDHDAGWNPDGLATMAASLAPDLASKDAVALESLKTTDWMGFYMPKLSVTLPAIFSTDKKVRPVVSMTNVVIDSHHGLTGSLNAGSVANPIVKFQDGSLGGWYFSLDNIAITFFDGSFIKANADGKIGLPIAANDPRSALDYTNTLSVDTLTHKLKYLFKVQPKGDLDVAIWKATMSLKASSTIIVEAKPNADVLVKADLNGDISFKADLGILDPNFKMELAAVQHLVVQSQEPYISVGESSSEAYQKGKALAKKASDFVGAFASPQKEVGGSPFTVDAFTPVVKPGAGGMKVGFYIHGNLSLTDIPVAPKAGAGIAVLANVSLVGGRPKFSYDGIYLEDVEVSGKLGPVSVDGKLKFFRADATYGDGFRGTLNAKFPMNIAVGADVRFGSVRSMNYWYVYASAVGLKIPVAPALLVTGFGGGAYYNMTAPPIPAPTQLPDPAKPADYTPKAGSIGCVASVFMTLGTDNLLKAQTTFKVDFDAQGINQVSLNGSADLFSPDGKPATRGIGHGDINIMYDVRNSIFDLNGGVLVSIKPLIEVNAERSLRIYADANTQFLKIGDPSDYNRRVRITVLTMLSGGAYFWTGNGAMPDVPLPVGIDQATLNAMGYRSFSELGFSQAAGGMMFGAAVKFPADKPTLDAEFLIFYIKLHASMGFDVSLAKYNQPCGTAVGPPGMNGWYAMGQVYAAAGFEFGVHVDVWFFEGRVNVASLEAAAIFQGGLPNPFWLKGMLYGHYSVLDGLVEGDMKFKLSVGDVCVPNQVINPFQQPLIVDTHPQEGKEIEILDNPSASFNYPVGREIVVTNNVPNKNGEGSHVETSRFRIDTEFTTRLKHTDDQGECANNADNAGELRVADDGLSETFYRRTAFVPLSDYDLTVTARAMELKGNQWQPMIRNGAPKVESKTVSIRTKGCPSKLTKSTIALTYPYDNQRYLLQGEFGRQGFVALNQRLCCFTEDIGPSKPYTLVMKFASESDPANELEAAVQEGSSAEFVQTFRFTIPNLPTASIIRMRMVKKPNPAYFNRLALAGLVRARNGGNLAASYNNYLTAASANAYNDSDFAKTRTGFTQTAREATPGGGFSMEVKHGTDGKLEAVPQEIEVLSPSYFRTSKYNTMAEKIRAMPSSASGTTHDGPGWLDKRNVKATFTVGEGFDQYDIGGTPKTIRGVVRYLQPLLGIEFSPDRSSWYVNNLKKYYDSNARSRDWKGYYFQFRDANNIPLDGLMPSLLLQDYAAPLQPNEIPENLKPALIFYAPSFNLKSIR